MNFHYKILVYMILKFIYTYDNHKMYRRLPENIRFSVSISWGKIILKFPSVWINLQMNDWHVKEILRIWGYNSLLFSKHNGMQIEIQSSDILLCWFRISNDQEGDVFLTFRINFYYVCINSWKFTDPSYFHRAQSRFKNVKLQILDSRFQCVKSKFKAYVKLW